MGLNSIIEARVHATHDLHPLAPAASSSPPRSSTANRGGRRPSHPGRFVREHLLADGIHQLLQQHRILDPALLQRPGRSPRHLHPKPHDPAAERILDAVARDSAPLLLVHAVLPRRLATQPVDHKRHLPVPHRARLLGELRRQIPGDAAPARLDHRPAAAARARASYRRRRARSARRTGLPTLARRRG